MAIRRPGFAAARKAAGYSQEALAEALHIDRSTVQRWESKGRQPQPFQWPKLAALLGVTRDELRELLVPAPLVTALAPVVTVEQQRCALDPPVTVGSESLQVDGGDDVERKAFLRAVAGSVAGLALGDPLREFVVHAASERTALVGRADVAQVRSMARIFADQDHGLIGGISADAVALQLKASRQLFTGRFATAVVRQQYISAVAELADVAAGMYFDAGSFNSAEHCFRLATGCAIEGGDWALRAKSLSGLANLAVHRGRTDEALSMAELALVRADRLPPVTRAVMHTREARALGLNGRQYQQACLRAVGQAEELFATGGEDEPVWMTYYSAIRLERDTGRALLYLALGGGEYAEAQARLTRAARQIQPATRGHVLTLANLAHLTMARDDPAQAVALGHEALDTLGSVRSDRVFHALRQLQTAGHSRESEPGVAELSHRINGVLSQSD